MVWRVMPVPAFRTTRRVRRGVVLRVDYEGCLQIERGLFHSTMRGSPIGMRKAKAAAELAAANLFRCDQNRRMRGFRI